MTAPLPPVAAGDRLTGWYVEALCPRCGAQLAHVADGRPSTTETRAVAQCTGCRREWGLELHIFPLAEVLPTGAGRRRRSTLPIPGLTHGTRSSYNQGCGCEPCAAAESAYNAARPRRQVAS